MVRRLTKGRPQVAQTSETVTRLLAPYTYQTASEEHRTVKYAPRYRLAFTLLNEDATTSQAAFSWDIRSALHGKSFIFLCDRVFSFSVISVDYLRPTLDRLSILHNFSVESQVQYHAPLAFTPRTIELHGAQAHGLTPEDLTVFINSAEWTLGE